VCLSLDSRNSVRVLPLSCRPWQGVARKELREEGRRERRERRESSAGVGVAWRGRSRIEGGSYDAISPSIPHCSTVSPP